MKIFTIEGKKYLLDKIKHTDGKYEMKLIPFDESEYRKTVDDIIKAVGGKINKRHLLEQAFANMGYDHIKKIHKALKKGIKAKAHRGCYEIFVGNEEIPLVG